MRNAFVTIEQLGKTYSSKNEELVVFEDVSFGIEKGEFVCIIGHSGCGKSTILNVLAGLDKPSHGGIIMDGKEVIGPSLDRGVVFQNYSLLPWLSTLQNVNFAVKARWPNWSKADALEHIEIFGAEDLRHHFAKLDLVPATVLMPVLVVLAPVSV